MFGPPVLMENVIKKTKVMSVFPSQTSSQPLASKTRRWILRTVSGLPLQVAAVSSERAAGLDGVPPAALMLTCE